MEAARREGSALHFADLDIDTRTPAGEMSANIIISGSQYERRLISQRTRDALAARRARGERLGAMPKLPVHVTRRILRERGEGRTYQSHRERSYGGRVSDLPGGGSGPSDD
jgi:DNA invertase Pin-like site-specific DNA recombinase